MLDKIRASLYDFRMSSIEVRTIYFPPDELDENKVGAVEIIQDENTRTIQSTFLGKPFGEEKVIEGKLLLEQRTRWAARRACSKVYYAAEAQLGYSSPAEQQDALLF